MRTLVGLSAAGVVLSVAVASGKPAGGSLLSDAEKLRPTLVETRRHFHAHPELSNREVETGKEIARRLEAMGYKVQRNVAGHGVVATLQGGKPGPLVAYRADIDALPITEENDLPFKSRNAGVMHACGHDVHITVGLGVAELLMKHRRDLHGQVRFIFQPAEEGAPPGEEGGAALMIKQRVLEPRPAAIFGLHTFHAIRAGTVAVRSGDILAAADRFTLKIKGKKSHGANPHDGIDAIYIASQVVNGLQGIVSRQQDARKPLVISVGSFHAGNRFNIIADEAVLEGTVRTLDGTTHARIEKDIQKVVAGITQAYGASYELDYDRMVPVTTNEAALTEQSIAVLHKTLGADKVTEWKPAMIAEDFGYFAQQVPAFFMMLGVGNPEQGITAGIHTPQFRVDEDALVTGVKAMSALIMARTAAH